jgi:hypothetical protein
MAVRPSASRVPPGRSRYYLAGQGANRELPRNVRRQASRNRYQVKGINCDPVDSFRSDCPTDFVGAGWVEPRGIEPLTSALPARERSLMEVRLCS